MSQKGHNKPPLDRYVAEGIATLVADDLASNPTPTGDLTSAQVATLADRYNAIRAAADRIDAARKLARQPHADAVKQVDSDFLPHVKAMRSMAASLRPHLEAYIDQNGPVAGKHALLSLRGAWKAEVIDLDAAFAHHRDNPEIEALLVKLSNAHMAKAKDKANAAIPGLLFRRKATVFASPVGDAPEVLVEEDE